VTYSDMVAQGRDERQSLQAILQVRPDHEQALKAMWQLELREGNLTQAEAFRAKLKAISPLGRGS